mgnify:CR=1
MTKVIRLVTAPEQAVERAAEVFPSLKTSWNRFCMTCQKSLRAGDNSCGREDCKIRELNPAEQEAETIHHLFL